MKELTIEQKAQRYDKALKVAKDIRNGKATYIQDGTPVIEALFPELAVSDDEKIRKSLLDYLYTLPNHFSHNGGLVIDWIAWLEKQGEKELVTWSENDERIKKAISDILLIDSDEIREILDSNNLLMQDIDTWLKNQGEQEAMDIAVAKCFEQGEQKPTWSEEDEKMWAQVINEIEAIKSNSSTVFEKNIAQDKIDWLKSLKDRYTWKPSDEQMEFLKKCIEAYNEVTFPTEVRVLSSLYNDLKQL